MMKRRLMSIATAAVLLGGCVAAAACAASGSSQAAASATTAGSLSPRAVIPEVTADRNMPEVTVSVKQGDSKATLDLSVAATEAERETGLMWIKSMPEDSGMIFLFAQDVTTSFWMENTYIPLDIAYISADGKLLGVNEGQPLDTTILKAPAPYRYAIETNLGWWKDHGFSAGAAVVLPNDLPAAS